MTLEIKQLSAGYGKQEVVKDLSFSIQAGEICGLIGLNGAGKSTTIKTIVGLLPPLSGDIEIQKISKKQHEEKYRKCIAYIPETPILYDGLTLREHLEITAKAYHQDTQNCMGKALELVDEFQLTSHLDWFPSYFSKGMKQKVLLICALMVDVPVLIVDEPFLGLDPLGIKTLICHLKEKQKQGVAILISTHVLDTAQRFCDRFVMLDKGEKLVEGSLSQLRMQYSETSSLEDIYFSQIESRWLHE